MTIESHLLLFRIILALTALFAILYDNYRHKDLRLVGFAYTFLVLGTISAFFSEKFFPAASDYSAISLFMTHLFAILIAGIFFALTAYKAHQKMSAVQQKTINAYMGKRNESQHHSH